MGSGHRKIPAGRCADTHNRHCCGLNALQHFFLNSRRRAHWWRDPLWRRSPCSHHRNLSVGARPQNECFQASGLASSVSASGWSPFHKFPDDSNEQNCKSCQRLREIEIANLFRPQGRACAVHIINDQVTLRKVEAYCPLALRANTSDARLFHSHRRHLSSKSLTSESACSRGRALQIQILIACFSPNGDAFRVRRPVDGSTPASKSQCPVQASG